MGEYAKRVKARHRKQFFTRLGVAILFTAGIVTVVACIFFTTQR